MCRSRPRRWLPAFVVIAALATESAALAQELIQAPATSPHSELAQAAPLKQATPEELGDSLMAHQRYQAAIEAYKKAPGDSASAWNKRGIANQLMFNYEDASRCYQASLKIKPFDANVINNLATVYDALKQFGAAERTYRRALKVDPQSAVAEKNLGTNLLAQHKYKKGWEAYKAALAIDPDIFQENSGPRVDNPGSAQDRGAMNYYLAKGCVRAGMKDQAIEYLRMALNEGFTTAKKITADSEFASLRGIPAFEQLLAEQHSP
jgi:tetratricopeptide (TPR) repeat protein